VTDFEEIFPVILNVLKDDTDLTSLCSEIRSGWLPKTPKYPCICVIRVSEPGEVAGLGGGSQWRSPVLQISVFAKRQDTADKIATQVLKTIMSNEVAIRGACKGIVMDAPNLVSATDQETKPVLYHNALRYPLFYTQEVS